MSTSAWRTVGSLRAWAWAGIKAKTEATQTVFVWKCGRKQWTECMHDASQEFVGDTQWAGFHVFARAETITASTRRPCSIQL